VVLKGLGFKYSFICQGTSTRRQQSDHHIKYIHILLLPINWRLLRTLQLKFYVIPNHQIAITYSMMESLWLFLTPNTYWCMQTWYACNWYSN